MISSVVCFGGGPLENLVRFPKVVLSQVLRGPRFTIRSS